MTQDYNQLAREWIGNRTPPIVIDSLARLLESVANTAKAETWDEAAKLHCVRCAGGDAPRAIKTDSGIMLYHVEETSSGERLWRCPSWYELGQAAAIRKQREWTGKEILDREA